MCKLFEKKVLEVFEDWFSMKNIRNGEVFVNFVKIFRIKIKGCIV